MSSLEDREDHSGVVLVLVGWCSPFSRAALTAEVQQRLLVVQGLGVMTCDSPSTKCRNLQQTTSPPVLGSGPSRAGWADSAGCGPWSDLAHSSPRCRYVRMGSLYPQQSLNR